MVVVERVETIVIEIVAWSVSVDVKLTFVPKTIFVYNVAVGLTLYN